MKPLSVGICGCGIGGLALATLLARAGHRVTAFDQFTEAAPVGSGFLLQPTGLAIMQKLDLLAPIERHGRVIGRFFGRDADTGRLVLDLRYEALPASLKGLAVLRPAVFDLLWQAAVDAGVSFDLGRDIAGTETIGNRRAVLFADGRREGPFDLVVDALGQRSILRPKQASVLAYGALWASLDWPAQGFDETAGEQRYRAASKMIGVVPSGTHDGDPVPKATFFWSIRGDSLTRWRNAPLDHWKEEVRTLWPATAPLLDGIAHHDDLTFA